MQSRKLDSIQFLRGIAVLLVVAFHFRQYINSVYAQSDLGDRLFGLGEVGVDIFFVISGFIIVYSSKNKENNTVSEFCIKRFFRLYPVYFLVLMLLVYLDSAQSYSFSKIVKSLFLIPNDYNSIGPWYGFSLNLPAWTLTYEVMFYTLFAVSIGISHKYRTLLCVFLMVAIVSASQLYFRGHLQIDPITRDAGPDGLLRNLTFLSSPIVYDFIFGMFIAEFYMWANDKLTGNKAFIMFMVCIFWISVALIISGYNRGGGIERWGLYSFALVGSLVMLSKHIDIRFGSFWIMVGEMSYSIYINHMVVKKLSGIYLRGFGIYKANGGITLFLILFILTFVMSYLTYSLIEKPSVSIGHKIAESIKRNRLRKMKSASTA